MKEGKLNKFKAELRAAVMGVLSKTSTDLKPPQIPEETQILNELIREYLDWNGYRYSEQILVAETGQSSEKMSREALSSKLGVLDDSRTTKIPLLYFVIADFQKRG